MRLFSLLLFTLATCVAKGTTLMKRIREKQNADDVMIRGLDLSGDTWLQVPQPIQDVLMSIDDKLRSLDTFSYTLKLARLDFSLDQLVRRMETIETKIGRLETKFDVRMEKIEEVVISKDIKEEFSNEHLSRGMENLNEKINNKAAYLDAKLDIKLERVMSKLELLERDLHNSVGDILERLIKSEERHMVLENDIIKKEQKLEDFDDNVSDLKVFLKEDLVSLVSKNYEQITVDISAVVEALHDEGNKTQHALACLTNQMLMLKQQCTNKIRNMSMAIGASERSRMLTDNCDINHRGITQQQLENLTAILEKALEIGEAKFNELDSDVELYSRKVINGIQELWKTSDELKIDLSNTIELGTKTREMVRREFQRLHEQIEPLPKLEPKLSYISEDLDKKVVELSATVDNSFATLLVAQNTFIASCKRIQEEEMHIYGILEQIVYEMRNRSIIDIHKINNEIQMQSGHINKSLTQVLKAVQDAENSTTSAVSDLIQHVRQSDQCVATRAVNWNTFCRQIIDNQQIDESVLNDEDIHSSLKFKTESNNFRSRSDNTQSKQVNVNDYDVDYPLNENDYNEHL